MERKLTNKMERDVFDAKSSAWQLLEGVYTKYLDIMPRSLQQAILDAMKKLTAIGMEMLK